MKIQDHVIHDGDQDETSNGDEKPPTPESIPSHARPLAEPLERLDTAYGRPTPDVVSPMKTFVEEIKMDGYPASVESETPCIGMGDPFRKILKHK